MKQLDGSVHVSLHTDSELISALYFFHCINLLQEEIVIFAFWSVFISSIMSSGPEH